MYRAIALFEYNDEELYDRVRVGILNILKYKLSKESDKALKKEYNERIKGLMITTGSRESFGCIQSADCYCEIRNWALSYFTTSDQTTWRLVQ
jgi:hypothetical protein